MLPIKCYEKHKIITVNSYNEIAYNKVHMGRFVVVVARLHADALTPRNYVTVFTNSVAVLWAYCHRLFKVASLLCSIALFLFVQARV